MNDQAAFTVPTAATMVLACWFDQGDLDDVVAALTSEVAALAADDWERAHPPTVRRVGLAANPASCRGSNFAEWAAGVVGVVHGTRPVDYSWHTASDIRFPMRCLGVPAVGLGPTAGGFYGPNEWVDLESLASTVELIVRMCTDDSASSPWLTGDEQYSSNYGRDRVRPRDGSTGT
jgi:acetylornithine deacetylase/succinyl-diaminopimelate desuccinylase-like protein